MRSEVELGRVVSAWLQRQCSAVYAEVVMPDGARADLVGRREDGAIVVVELKRAMSLTLLAQAQRRRVYGSVVFVAIETPSPKQWRSDGYKYARECLVREGVGLLLVDATWGVRMRLQPKANRERHACWDALLAHHKPLAEAGSPGGVPYWTRYKATCAQLLAYVREHEGCGLREAVRAVPHHYRTERSAISTLRKRIEKGVVPGVCCARAEHVITLHTKP